MSLIHGLSERKEENRPIRVGIIGAGRFASMFLVQARTTPGIHISGVCDLDLSRAENALLRAGYPREQFSAASMERAAAEKSTHLTDDAASMIASDHLDVVVDATGDPLAGIHHALACFEAGRHIVMVNVEADALAGPFLARKAKEAGVVYSLAYGDQPALIVELVNWARTCGFEVVCAGKGTRYLPSYHESTPETVWNAYGIEPEEAAKRGMNPKMYNSFVDGTKSAIEMAAVANATALQPPAQGLSFPPCGVGDLQKILRPRSDGGTLGSKETVEVVSSQNRDGSEVVGHLRWGVYVTFEAANDFAAACLSSYGLAIDDTGRYAAHYRPYHLIGLELGVSVASAGLRGEPTGVPLRWTADVVAIAKRDLAAGEILDGEGGSTVWGRLTTAIHSVGEGALPIGLSSGVKIRRSVSKGAPVHWADVEFDPNLEAVRVRRLMEKSL